MKKSLEFQRSFRSLRTWGFYGVFRVQTCAESPHISGVSGGGVQSLRRILRPTDIFGGWGINTPSPPPH
ncbi:hypothetical protein GQ55_7G030500 [Panicum hallii var. hallii]|uniref:Uncharacterized protein n=1 Tax=Panicum hallii var. hallii TaxID=1504633 RepID=A0A2T7CS79_9POAL|nr:hypothetical protein GQ55_7G030500 [Panicum hallii var. hallii]